MAAPDCIFHLEKPETMVQAKIKEPAQLIKSSGSFISIINFLRINKRAISSVMRHKINTTSNLCEIRIDMTNDSHYRIRYEKLKVFVSIYKRPYPIETYSMQVGNPDLTTRDLHQMIIDELD
jgi:hypothetical protein